MKKSITIIAIAMAILSTLYFTNSSVAGKAEIVVLSLNGQTVLNTDYDVTFNFTLKSGSVPSEGILKVNTNSSFTGTQVGSQVLSSSSSETIHDMSLSQGIQYYWKVFRVSDGADISPSTGTFTAP